jgi:hypothetical protein
MSTDSSNPYVQIDVLYADVLESATEEAPGCTNSELCRRVGDLLCTIVLLEKPVLIFALAHLTGILEFEEIQEM